VQIYKNRATNNHNASKRIISYDDWKFDYIKSMSRNYPDELRDADVTKKRKWSAIVYSFGIEFAKILEGTIARNISVDAMISSILDGWEDEDDVTNLRERVIEAFCNMRGKDYVRKRRALTGFNFTETHRSTIGTLAKRAKDEAEKMKGEDINANAVFDNEINVDKMLCPELRAELRKRKLFVTGKKAELITRLKDDIANRKRAERESG